MRRWRSHCCTAIAKRDESKLKVRLINQSVLIFTVVLSGVKARVMSSYAKGGTDEFIMDPPNEKEESWSEMCERSLEDISAGSAWRLLYESTTNAVTTAENRPAYTGYELHLPNALKQPCAKH